MTSVDDEPTPAFLGGEGTPLVLLHGANMSWRAWRPVIPFLTGRHQVYAPTLAGHCGAELPLRDGATPGIAAIVDVLCDQLDAAGIDTAHVAGNSLGGWAALEFARRGRARSVTGISPAGTWRAERDIQRLLWMFRMARGVAGSPRLRPVVTRPALRRTMLRRMVEHPEHIPPEEVSGIFEDMVGCAVLDDMLDSRAEFGQLENFDVALCPVRIAWAERDRVIPWRRFGKPMQRVVSGAEFVVLPGVGHVPMHDDPRLIARTILEVTSAADAVTEARPTGA